ncbi:MAG: alpha/beta fold hydrolase [Bryobacteraceae bacterium]
MAIVLIVHGAWGGGWSWSRVRPLLRSAGFDVHTPTLTGLGERSHLYRPGIDLQDHVQDVIAVLEYEDLRDVVLVGHSYGGMVIRGVADHASERVERMIYLDAFVPEHGESIADLIGPGRIPFHRTDGRIDPLPPAAAGIDREEDLHWILARETGHPHLTLTQPISLLNPAIELPSAYIYCNNPAIGLFEASAMRAKLAGWEYRELPTGHSPNVTHPELLAETLIEICGNGHRSGRNRG